MTQLQSPKVDDTLNNKKILTNYLIELSVFDIFFFSPRKMVKGKNNVIWNCELLNGPRKKAQKMFQKWLNDDDLGIKTFDKDI